MSALEKMIPGIVIVGCLFVFCCGVGEYAAWRLRRNNRNKK